MPQASKLFFFKSHSVSAQDFFQFTSGFAKLIIYTTSIYNDYKKALNEHTLERLSMRIQKMVYFSVIDFLNKFTKHNVMDMPKTIIDLISQLKPPGSKFQC